MPYSVYLKKNEEKRIIAGHPWVYANEVARIEGKDKNGSLATVYDYNGRYIGKGYINHLSKILVRIFIRDDSQADYEFYKNAIKKSNDYRRALGFDNCYRAVFAESDNLPALIVDKYADVLCVQFLSLGIEKNKDLIIKALIEIFNPKGIYERSDVQVREKEGLELRKGAIYGQFDTKVMIEENGLKMLVDLENGQKTGYFLDQKENRYALRRYAQGSLLDCFCNCGGFSLNAAKAGAKEVIALDISEQALSDVRQNASLNGINNITTMQGDVFEVLRSFKKEGKTFDTIVLDPPAFCKSASEVKNAYKGYKDINILGMKLVKSGGYLVTSSCSHYMTFPLFQNMLAESARECGRKVRIVEIRTQSPDHPSTLSTEESLYLKFFVLQVT
ncbi:MAG: class I SAM-dependent rRNA methyltransferase [Clostridia bacterium]|nr:class I SAM-dependent rRNA methyltransferase [Clostridia bacterium]MDE7328923.1 class I SAM-dependent rRNA methyltransferase [Clostridia bacterium]